MLSAFASTAISAATQSATQTAISPFGGALSTSAFPGDTGSFADALTSVTAPLTTSPATSLPAGPATGAIPASAPFSDLLVQSVRQVDQLSQTASNLIEGLISGKGVDVHEAMIASEKASMGFDMMLAVRDKAVAAYQQVMSMQF